MPTAAQLVCGVPLVADRVDVQGRLLEVEAVRYTRRNRESSGRLGVELDDGAQAFGLGPFAQVVQPDRRPPGDDRQVIRVLPVRVHAAQDVGLGANHVPLHRLDRERP